MKINKKIIFGVFILSIFITSYLVSAFAVSMPYMEGKKLYLLPGETEEIEFVLQNSAGTENISIKAIIKKGSEIMEITDASDIYNVVPGEHTKVNTKITIPSDAQINDSYDMLFGFSTVSEAGGGFEFGTGINQGFQVIVGERPEEEESEKEETTIKPWHILLLGLIIIILIIIFIKKRKK